MTPPPNDINQPLEEPISQNVQTRLRRTRTVPCTSKCAGTETCVRTRASGAATHTHGGDKVTKTSGIKFSRKPPVHGSQTLGLKRCLVYSSNSPTRARSSHWMLRPLPRDDHRGRFNFPSNATGKCFKGDKSGCGRTINGQEQVRGRCSTAHLHWGHTMTRQEKTPHLQQHQRSKQGRMFWVLHTKT